MEARRRTRPPGALRRRRLGLSELGLGGFAAQRPPQRLWTAFARPAVGQVADLLGRSGSAGSSSGVVLRVAELEAGTGVLTGQLVRARVPLVAVEAAGDARRHLRRALPTALVIGAEPTRLPFRSGALSSVVTTNSALLSAPGVASEVRRVVGADGLVVLLHDLPEDEASPLVPSPLGAGDPTLTAHPHTGSDGSRRRSEVLVWRAT